MYGITCIWILPYDFYNELKIQVKIIYTRYHQIHYMYLVVKYTTCIWWYLIQLCTSTFDRNHENNNFFRNWLHLTSLTKIQCKTHLYIHNKDTGQSSIENRKITLSTCLISLCLSVSNHQYLDVCQMNFYSETKRKKVIIYLFQISF